MIIARLKKLQEESHQFANGSELMASLKNDIALRNEIEFLSKSIFHKSVSGCSNCYFDAYIQLRTLNIDTVMEKIKCLFLLLAGALLHDVVNQNNDLLCSNANITDDLALYHLKTNPACRKYFQELPENVDELIAAYVLPSEEPELTDEEKQVLELAIQDQVDAENKFASDLALEIQSGVTKTAIKEKYKSASVGNKKLTQRSLADFISRAVSILEAPAGSAIVENTEVGGASTENLETDVDTSETEDTENTETEV